MDESIEKQIYQVVINDELQYSIWPAATDPPAGWTAEGCEGTRELCLGHIARVWTDMRPASARRSVS